ncbi:Zeta toxin [Legionella massiliensis]|uniref:Zeta toxin n=1 Tax=Legionella massiliensis TaxID=1034943 RepID=A0A078KVK0_9GAMM|nr:zeta toxin family protein [Legionella massiliensis]CDZ77011.1 Zeta toxin [Legionella massiliensis]CEE12749.1 Zeta toxin [Legionella massiliensis]
MVKTIAKQRVNFGVAEDTELSRHEYHRTLRAAIELSATSHSYQETETGAVYQWDNIAPEIARVIIDEAKERGISISQEVIQEIGLEAYNNQILDNILSLLTSNPDYALFTEKLALAISDGQSTQLSLEVLLAAGIDSPEKLDQIYTQLLLGQKKLTKNFPNFNKIHETDDYAQVIEYLISQPLFDKFLRLFTASLAKEYNAGRAEVDHIQPPSLFTKDSLANFLQSLSTNLVLKAPPVSEKLTANTLYMEIVDDKLEYTVIAPNGQRSSGWLSQEQLGFAFNRTTTEEELKQHLPTILKITEQRKHTGHFINGNTALLKEKGQGFLKSETTENIFLSHLPAVDLVKDEAYKFSIYQWVEQGNMPVLKDQIVARACSEYERSLNSAINKAKQAFPMDEDFATHADAIAILMREIAALTASLEVDAHEQDIKLDTKIAELAEHLTWMKDYYGENPIQKEGETFPSTAGNFNDFLSKVVFGSNSKKVVSYLPNPEDQSGYLKLDLLRLVQQLINNDAVVRVRSSTQQGPVNLVNESHEPLAPARVLREQLKEKLTAQLKNNVHHHYTLQSYENDNLKLQQAPLTFRGGNVEDTLEKTRTFAKKMTRGGEFSADSHLLIGQENNLKKHETRSATASKQIASTGNDGTRSATESLDVAMRFGGNKDVKILYILRGKNAFNSQDFLDPIGKNSYSEIAYTHVDPSDYVMTIIYNKDNTILGVIPGDLSGEISGINEFTREVLQAGIDFYNISHDSERVGTVKLPKPDDQATTAPPHLKSSKSLMGIIESHKTETTATKQPNTGQLASVRIQPTQAANGSKQLAMSLVRPGIVLTPPSTLSLPKQPFHFDPRRLLEVQIEANRQYRMRHVLTLNSFTRWSRSERLIQENYNRILQSGFMDGPIDEQLHHANIAQEEWLTDVLVPRVDTALLLNIAARLITDYAVDVEEVNVLSQEMLLEILSETGTTITDIRSKIFSEFDSLAEAGPYQECLEKAKAKMGKIYPMLEPDTHGYTTKLASCFAMERNKYIKKRTHELVGEFLDLHFAKYAAAKNLQLKPVFPLADNKDYVFLGAAASGKSTISNQYFSPEDKKNFVSLATDDYRGICRPYTGDFEKEETEQVFVRTQDSAYLVSELVEERMRAKKSERPNVIVDGVTYKASHRELVEQNKNSIVVCACLDDMSLAVKRSYDRAMKEDAGSADKGRHINTSSLIAMHKTASINLIKYCAPNSRIAFYDTNVPRGTNPPLIAVVDTHVEKTLTVSNEPGALMRVTSFFNKARVNVNAQGDDSLFFSKSKKTVFQIDSLFAVLGFGYKIALNGENDKPYLSIEKNPRGGIVMQVIDPQQLEKKLSESSGAEKELMQMLVLYAHYGSLKEVNKQLIVHDGKIDSLVAKILPIIMATSTISQEVKPDQGSDISLFH